MKTYKVTIRDLMISCADIQVKAKSKNDILRNLQRIISQNDLEFGEQEFYKTLPPIIEEVKQ